MKRSLILMLSLMFLLGTCSPARGEEDAAMTLLSVNVRKADCRMLYRALLDYAAHGGASRGSGIYYDPEGTSAPGLDFARFRADGDRHAGEIQETVLAGGQVQSRFRPVHPIPEGGGFFENVWKRYWEDRNVW